MNKLTLWICLASLVVISGCANTQLVQERNDCQRNLFFVIPWDDCEDIKEPVPTRQVDIRGEGKSSTKNVIKEDVVIADPVIDPVIDPDAE